MADATTTVAEQKKYKDDYYLIESCLEDHHSVLADNFGDDEQQVLNTAIVKDRRTDEHGWDLALAMQRIVTEGDGYSVITRKVYGRKRGDEIQLFGPEGEMLREVGEMAWFMEMKRGFFVYGEAEESPTEQCITSLKQAITAWSTTIAIPASHVLLAGAGQTKEKQLRLAIIILDEPDFLSFLHSTKPHYIKDKRAYPICGTYYAGTVTRHIGTKKFRSCFTPTFQLVDPVFINDSSSTADSAALAAAKKKKEELRKKESKARKKARKAAEAAEEEEEGKAREEAAKGAARLDEGGYSSSNQEIREGKTPDLQSSSPSPSFTDDCGWC
ncbi:hypothetical protein LTR78_005089 [Recurvomyces mirabilis]|uniref:Uncharacterized protein n=1 Tax=Recurvomyces mirabilis TaxID=574656 RepID=A0AAE0WP27_9PEZI|nr:hypothetical protein LTR78_005089 [Recurvomyces mirabilis]KAK5158294.1 hypothetical protein LTS14_003312 [Recurvomyces mirabilis]